MFPTQSQILEVQKNQVDAIQAFGKTLFDAAEKLTELNLSTSRSLMDDGTGAVHSLLAAKDPQEAAAIAGTLAQPNAEKLASYSRSAYGIVSGVGAELGRLFDSQLGQGNRKLAELIDIAAKAAPAGSEAAIGILRNSFSTANAAFETVARAARQASETAESNIAAAVAVAADAVKTKSKK